MQDNWYVTVEKLAYYIKNWIILQYLKEIKYIFYKRDKSVRFCEKKAIIEQYWDIILLI